jgi:HemY protein
MKFGLFLVLILLIGSIAAHFLLENNGYVLINFRGYTIEMSVPVLIFVAFLAYLAVRALVRIWQAPRELGEMAARARSRHASQRITKGFIALSEGKLARGERLLTKGAADSETPLLNYLTAARAAQAQGDRQRRDGWLKMAQDSDGGTKNAVLLTQAELQIAAGEYQPARKCLAQIRESQPNHPQALKLLGELLYIEQDWHALTDLLPQLRRAKNIPTRTLEEWTIEAFEAELTTPNLDIESINAYWNKLPRALRKHERLLRARVNALIAGNNNELAATTICKALKTDWDSELTAIYGKLKLADKDEQLRQTEKWLNQYPEDPVILLAAGRCCIRNQLWGKARSYIESSLAIAPTPAAYHELGHLMLKLDETAAATTAFAKGLTLSNTGASDIPRLENTGP